VLATLEGEGLVVRSGRRRYPARRHRTEDRVIAVEHIFRTNEHPFFGPLSCGIVDTFLDGDYGVHSFIHRDDGSDESKLSNGAVISNMLERGILRGVIFPFSTPRHEDVSIFRQHGVAVCTMSVVPGPGVVLIDMEQAALQGTHYMAKLGVGHIGIVNVRSMSSDTGVQGYKQALLLNDMPYREEDVIDCSDYIQDTLGYYMNHSIPCDVFRREILKPIIEGARLSILSRIRAGNFPRGLYIADEFLAIGTIRALQEAGLRVPEDVAVVSHMSSGNGAVELTGITTTQFDGYCCGMEAARFVIDIAESRRPIDDRLSLPTRLVKGVSCGEMSRVEEDESVSRKAF
jgi:DNA-binding LacI/PurR family transcriptional regulator